MKRRIRFLACVGLAGSLALAFGPEDALRYRPPELGLESARLALARENANFAALGLGGSASLAYDRDLTAQLNLTLDLDPLARLSAEDAKKTAEARLRAALRDGVYRALKAHAGLWAASANQKAAKARLAAARLRLRAARAKGSGPLELAAAENAAKDAELALEAAAIERESAALEAAALGLTGPAEPRTLLFLLPPPRPDDAARRAAAIAALKAEKARRSLLALSGRLAYQGAAGYALGGESAGPSLTLSIGPKSPLMQEGEWRAELKATLRLDPAAWTGAEEARLLAEEAEKKAKDEAEDRARRLLALRRRAELQARRLALAEARQRLSEKHLARTRRRLAAGLVSSIGEKEAEADLAAAEAERARAWGAYLDAVKAYLDLADGEWRTR